MDCFKKVYGKGTLEVIEIQVDTETGVRVKNPLKQRCISANCVLFA